MSNPFQRGISLKALRYMTLISKKSTPALQFLHSIDFPIGNTLLLSFSFLTTYCPILKGKVEVIKTIEQFPAFVYITSITFYVYLSEWAFSVTP